jgi:hypothetical protein
VRNSIRMLSPAVADTLGVTENYHNPVAEAYLSAGVATNDGWLKGYVQILLIYCSTNTLVER